MSILKVAHMGHPVLRAKARSIDRADIKSAAVQKLIDDMIETMQEYHGVGLAGPQVHEGVRLFVATLDAGRDVEAPSEPIAIVNPEITPVTNEVVEDWEGCLSIPDIRGRVPGFEKSRCAPSTATVSASRFAPRTFRHGSSSTKPIISMASCSSIG